MKRMLTDLWRVLKGAGLKLDEEEEEALGGPEGQTISMWMALRNRHGNALAHVFCLALYLVQFQHCRKQLAGQPMAPRNYVRAIILLVLFAPVAVLFGAVRIVASRV